MSRLFITSKEIAFINDITKELIKDVIGQQIIYYPISTMKTKIHPVYEEAIEKIFENPIILDVLAAQPAWETKWNQFGNEQTNKFEVFVQARDLIDKGYNINEGDFFVYDSAIFEVLAFINMNNIFGQAEYTVCYKIEAKLARKGQLDLKAFKAMLMDQNVPYIENTVTKVWQQQRGLPENVEGATLDKRQMRDRMGDDMAPIALGEGARVINIDNDADPQHKPNDASNFVHETPIYNEPTPDKNIYDED